jgi:squalene-hopene/tetraprenyl-beta-curcumene cyclase
LWFGNEHAPGEQNLTYGTSRVVAALATLAASKPGDWFEPYFQRALQHMLASGIAWLLKAQHQNGGWSGGESGPASIEETALALAALAGAQPHVGTNVTHALTRGANWLVEQVESGAWKNPAPIGFYFARVWYYERLYPLIFTTAALSSLASRL